MSLAGHVSRDMLNHHPHIRLDAKRRAPVALENAALKKRDFIVTERLTSQTEEPAEAGNKRHVPGVPIFVS